MTDHKKRDLIATFKNLRRHRSPTKEFANFLDMINVSEEQRQKTMQEELNLNYQLWAEHYKMLKDEFNALWDFFHTIENKSEGWFCVSPFISSWKSVGHNNREGYLFGTTITKNHQRHAPMSEKSLAVSFAVEEWGGGIGDEREVGRISKIDDQLCGLSACTGKGLNDQFQGAKRLATRVGQFQLQFRLNHKDIGQQTSRVSLEILGKYNLIELSEKLFVLLNKDLLGGLNKELEGLNQKLLDKE